MREDTKRTKKEIENINNDDGVIDNKLNKVTIEEQKLTAIIENDFESSQSVRQSEVDENSLSIEDEWEDNYKLYKGGGLQWSTNKAYRSRAAKANRPNSEDNFIFNILQVQISNITSITPEVSLNGVEDEDEEIAEKLTFMSKFNDEKNKFKETFKKWVYDFCSSGATIGMVIWDNDWIGGRGPKRWIGDIRFLRIPKEEMFFDPAILDLKENLNNCSYIIRRVRKKLDYIKKRWEKGNNISEEWNEDENINEGEQHKQAYLIEYWHRGFPHFIPKKRKEELLNQAENIKDRDSYKANDYIDSSKGLLEGIHVAYYVENTLLEYIPYEYDHGNYPFSFTTKYMDEKNQFGFGEIRNLAIPQIMHNKADELELEAMCKQGLGGYLYQKGALSQGQKNKFQENNAKGGQILEVDNLANVRPREGVQVPSAVREYKQNKERIINAIQPATTIQQGISPGSNVPLGTVQELGNRTDVRMKQVSDDLKDFLIRMNELRLALFLQFYTEERYYRVRGSDKKVNDGFLKSDEMTKSWVRDEEFVKNKNGDIETLQSIEEYMPEFDIEVSVMSEKPTDRGYNEQLANILFDKQLLSPEDLLFTIENGKLPPTKEILKHIYSRQPIMDVLSKIQELPEELQQQIMDILKQSIQNSQQMFEQQQQQQEQQELEQQNNK